MTREEERIKQIEQFASQCYEYGEKYSAFISGAIWADNNPAQDVVNLNDLWHDASEEPQYDLELIIYKYKDNFWLINKHNTIKFHGSWKNFVSDEQVIRWAYAKDIFPKGGKV